MRRKSYCLKKRGRLVEDKIKSGVVFGILTLLTSALLPITSKFTLNYLSPLAFSSLSMLAAAAVSLLLIAATGSLGLVLPAAKKIWKLVFFSYVLFSLFFFLAQKHSSATVGIIIFQLEAVFAFAFSFLLFGQKPHKLRLALVVAAAAAVGFALSDTSELFTGQGWTAAFFIAAVACVQLGYALSHNQIENIGALHLVCAASAMGGIGPLSLAVAFEGAEISAIQAGMLPFVILHGILGWLLSYLFYYESMKRIGVPFATALLVPTPAVSMLLASVFLGEATTLRQQL
ncbi:DMT family transporter, partial [Candidatus Parvarchaeota archaeon]|nr:DMT family transporter [Candidatus Parvarchaeota archaeon]